MRIGSFEKILQKLVIHILETRFHSSKVVIFIKATNFSLTNFCSIFFLRKSYSLNTTLIN